MTLYQFVGDPFLYSFKNDGYYPVTLGELDRASEARKTGMLRVVKREWRDGVAVKPTTREAA